jgi:RNA polymerase sigma-70 factor (ECF subfamily)
VKEKKLPSICEEHQFDHVYREHSKSLYNFIYYRSGNQELSNDLVQDAFLKLWTNCAKVKFEQAKSFLYTVARNAFLNKVERKKVALKFENQIQSKVNSESPDHILEQKEFQEKLEKGINSLTDGQREVFLMNRIDGLKYREIAELLDISQKAVEKRMHLALINLRKIHDQI